MGDSFYAHRKPYGSRANQILSSIQLLSLWTKSCSPKIIFS